MWTLFRKWDCNCLVLTRAASVLPAARASAISCCSRRDSSWARRDLSCQPTRYRSRSFSASSGVSSPAAILATFSSYPTLESAPIWPSFDRDWQRFESRLKLADREKNLRVRTQTRSCSPPVSKMQAPVIVMNDASARQTGRKAQTSNITAAKVVSHVDY
jgi:hypothetical protein